MRKVPEIPFPLSTWPHAVVQAVLAVVCSWVLKDVADAVGLAIFLNYLSAVKNGMNGWYLLAVAWLIYVFLLGELVVRRSQGLAAKLSPEKPWAFHLATGCMVVVFWYALFVLIECVLFRVAIGFYPTSEKDKLPFYLGYAHTFVAHSAFMLVILMGEFLRQLIYRKRMQQWWHEYTLQRQNPKEEMDGEIS
jgi:hypothetical protein